MRNEPPDFSASATERFHVPDLVAELGQLRLIDRIELELLLRFNQDASVEATAPEDDGHLNVGILIQDVLYALFSFASMGISVREYLPNGPGLVCKARRKRSAFLHSALRIIQYA